MGFFKKLGKVVKGAAKGVVKGTVGSIVGKSLGLPGTGGVGTAVSAIMGARDELKKGKSKPKKFTAKQLETKAAAKKVGEAIKSSKEAIKTAKKAGDQEGVKAAMGARREAISQARTGVKAAKSADYSSTKGQKFTPTAYEDHKSRQSYMAAKRSGDTAQADQIKSDLEARVKARRTVAKPAAVPAPQMAPLRSGGFVKPADGVAKRGKTRGRII